MTTVTIEGGAMTDDLTTSFTNWKSLTYTAVAQNRAWAEFDSAGKLTMFDLEQCRRCSQLDDPMAVWAKLCLAIHQAAVEFHQTAIESERKVSAVVLRQALNALEYLRTQTRPIYSTDAAIQALKSFEKQHDVPTQS